LKNFPAFGFGNRHPSTTQRQMPKGIDARAGGSVPNQFGSFQNPGLAPGFVLLLPGLR
jgi:hypothetical protein